MKMHLTCLLVFASICGFALAATPTGQGRDLLNTCLQGKKHKYEPGPEDDLHKQCAPWKKRACCTGNTTQTAHYGKSYNFNYDHCANHTMSDKCRKHFVQDLCFYECSPNVGPWLQPVKQKIRREKFINVPLCQSECDAWFNDCKDDWTCTSNWGENFDWIDIDNDGKNENVCPVGSECRPFLEIFKTSTFFCENIWDNSWKVTPDNEPCMKIWFDENSANPNDAVAKWKVDQLSQGTEKPVDSRSATGSLSAPGLCSSAMTATLAVAYFGLMQL